jgi:hypothetical protein
MEEALSFFRAFEIWIYFILGLGGLFYIRKFMLAWQEMKEAGFGLERENAQVRLNQAASVLVLLLMMTVAEFVLVSFIAPSIPGANPLPTPTLSILATPTTTLPSQSAQAVQTEQLSTPATAATPNPTGLATEQLFRSACLPGQIEITSPTNGQQVSGVVEVIGTADIPGFGFYKFETRHTGDAEWVTIQAGNEVKQKAKLGDWDTRRLSPGEYQLGLVVVDNQGRISQPCVVSILVNRAPGTAEP